MGGISNTLIVVYANMCGAGKWGLYSGLVWGWSKRVVLDGLVVGEMGLLRIF